jgi:phage baseplate assembly protein W
MSRFSGFNTIGQEKKFTLVDFELVKRDILNSFLIRLGEVPGRPGYGTTIQNIVFENLTADVVRETEEEIRRVIGQDPRVKIERLQMYVADHIILAEIELTVLLDQTLAKIFINFDTNTQSISLL